MIIWSGFGIMPVVFLIFFGGICCLTQDGPPGGPPLALALFLTGVASGGTGWYLRKRGDRVVVDKATGQEFTLRQSHSLFFIPMLYWGPIFGAMGVYVLIEAALKH